MACGCGSDSPFSHVEHRTHFHCPLCPASASSRSQALDQIVVCGMSKIHVKTTKGRLDSCCQSLTVAWIQLSLKEIHIGVRTGSDVRSATPVVRSLLAARTRSIVPPKLSLSHPTRIVSLLEGCHQLDRPDFHRPDGFRLVGEQGAVASEVWSGYQMRTSRPAVRCLRTNSRASSDTSGVQSGR